MALLSEDEFDQWCASLNSRRALAASSKYVSDDVIGMVDLDNYGEWKSNADYGNVWYPSDVSSDWVPYRDGSRYGRSPGLDLGG